MEPGEPEKQNGDYARKGTCSILIFIEPLASGRHPNSAFLIFFLTIS
jgi:hypothetical protein